MEDRNEALAEILDVQGLNSEMNKFVWRVTLACASAIVILLWVIL